jgi:hypothetical protein
MDEARLERHLRWSGVDLARSAVLLVSGKPAAFSLAALERRGGEMTAWIAGFGVAPEHRRQGLAGRLMREHCEVLDEAGVRETLLEVIDENPARRVYAAAGFREVRALLSFQGHPIGPLPVRCQPLTPADFQSLHVSLNHVHRPVWRRDLHVLERMLQDLPTAQLLAVPAVAGYAAYALVVAGPERIGILDAAAADADSAQRLVSGLAAEFPGQPMRIIDQPERSPLAEAFAAAEMTRLLAQFEMVRRP